MFARLIVSRPRAQTLVVEHSRRHASLVAAQLLAGIPALLWFGRHALPDYNVRIGIGIAVLVLALLGLMQLGIALSGLTYTFDARRRVILRNDRRLTDFDAVRRLHLQMDIITDRNDDEESGTYTLRLDCVGGKRHELACGGDGPTICRAALDIAALLDRPLVEEETRQYGDNGY